jgi:hypothetical protein
VRRVFVLVTLGCCIAAAAPGAAPAATATPRFQLLGDWSFHGHRYRFTAKGATVDGRSLSTVRVGRCVVKAGTLLFRGYRYMGFRAKADTWRGRIAVVGGSHCRRTLVSSTITQSSELFFSESSRLPGGHRPPPGTFKRVRPPLSPTDPVLGTWVRNGAGVIVSLEGPLYVGRAREQFTIANGCTVTAGTVVWRMRPVGPDRYSGTIQTFFGPPGCAPASLDASTWILLPGAAQLVREAPQGQAFPYSRA